jgi:hypothetical protein
MDSVLVPLNTVNHINVRAFLSKKIVIAIPGGFDTIEDFPNHFSSRSEFLRQHTLLSPLHRNYCRCDYPGQLAEHFTDRSSGDWQDHFASGEVFSPTPMGVCIFHRMQRSRQ